MCEVIKPDPVPQTPSYNGIKERAQKTSSSHSVTETARHSAGRDIGCLPGVDPWINMEATGSNTAITRKGETKSRSSDLCRYTEWQLEGMN